MSGPKGDILCIHYYFPPLRSSAVIRNYHVSLTLCDYFEHVHVLTSNNHSRFPAEERSTPLSLTRYDISTFDYRYFLGKKSKNDAHISSAKKEGYLYKLLLKIQKSFPFNLLLAEGNLLYILRAYRKATTLIKKQNITTVYSSFGPYADHYVTWLIKRKYPQLKWIADFRDLQIEPIYKNVIWKGLQQSVERRVLSKADLITCISNGFVKQLSPYGRPTIAMLRGVDLRMIEPQFEKFTISYTGSLYFNYRDPRPLFRVLNQMITDGLIDENDINIRYAGRDGSTFENWIKEYHLSECFFNLGLVSQKEAKSLQNKSHINLLLTSSSPELTGVITGKIFEYFEALNPTLCLISGVYDPEFEALFTELNAGCVVYAPERTQGKMQDFILSKYKEWKLSQRVESTIDQDLIKEKYSWKSQVEMMLANLDYS